MKLKTLVEKMADTVLDVKKNIAQDRGYQVAVFFDLDGTLFLNDAQWKILPNKVEKLNGFLPLLKTERGSLRVTQERGAKFAEALRTKAGITDITKFFDMSEFSSKEEYLKQIRKGKPIESMISVLQKHATYGHKIYILTARSGSPKDLASTFGREIDKYAKVGPNFTKRGGVYTVNVPKFKDFWKELGIFNSADKKAAIIQSYLKYQDGEEPFEGNPKKELFLRWRNEHEDKLVDKAYFYDDEMPNITAVEAMLLREKNKLLQGESSVIIHFVKSEEPETLKEALKSCEVEMKLAGITKHQVIKELNEEDEMLSNMLANEKYDEGEILLKRKAIVELYRDLSKDNFERKFSNKFKFEIVEMANMLGIPQTNNKEGLTEMIYERIKELNEMAKIGQLIKVDDKLLKITKGNKGRGTEVEAGGKTFKLKNNNPKNENGKTFFEVSGEVTAGEKASKEETKKTAVKELEKKRGKVKGNEKIAIPKQFRPGSFVSAFTNALKNNKTTGVADKGGEDTFSVEKASAFISRFKQGLSKQTNLKFKDALTKLVDVADVITKIYAGSATEGDKSKLDSFVAGVKVKSGKEMTFSEYLTKLKTAGKDDTFHTKIKERLSKVIDKKTAAIEKSLGSAKGDKRTIEEDLVYLNSEASRLLDKIEEASMYESGIKMFLEGIIEHTPEEEKDALHKNLKTAFKALALNKPAYEEVLN